MLYLLLLVLVLIFVFVVFLDKDIFSPSAIICESYILAVLCAMLNIKNWNISLSMNTFKMIIIGVLSFVIPSLILLHTYLKRKQVDSNIDDKKKSFVLNKRIYLLFIVLQFITLFLYLYYVIKTVGGIQGLFNLSDIMQDYREGTSYGDLESQIPTFVNQCVKVSQLIAYISLYYLIHYKIIKRKNSLKIINIISIVLYLILSLLSGGRYRMISFFLGTILMWFMLNSKIKESKVNLKSIVKVLSIVILILFVFSQSRTMVGRTSEDDFVSYISTYFGGSIQSLNLYLDDSYVKSEFFGKETFYAINNTLSKFGIIEPYRMHLEFRTSNGSSLGNVYTALRCFYQDFGYYGVVFLQGILGIFWTGWYKKIRKNKNLWMFDSSIIFYCIYINCLFFNSYRDNFFSSTLSVATLTTIIYFIIIKKVLVKEIIEKDELEECDKI